MATTTKTFAFASTSDGWTLTAGTWDTVAFNSGDGNPAGSLRFNDTGRNDTASTTITWTGTFEDLGVTPGHVVTGYSAAAFDHRCGVWNVVDSASLGPFDINDGTARTLVAAQSFTGTTAWATKSASPGITSLSLPSTTSITLSFTAAGDNGNNNAAQVELRLDNVSLTIDHDLPPAVVHDTTGALSAGAATVAGSATHFTVHGTSGVLSGSGAQVVGSAERITPTVTHDTSGVLSGPGTVLSGSADRFRAFATSGVLTGAGSVVVGDAARSGAVITHATTGALSGLGAVVTGDASSFTIHGTTGALAGQGAEIVGSAARVGAPIVHETSGALAGAGAVLLGVAQNGTQPVPVLDLGDGVGPWRKKDRKQRDQRIAQERREREQLRTLIAQAIDPISEPEVKVVASASAVTIVPKAGQAVAIPALPTIDVAEVQRAVNAALQTAGIAAKQARDAQAKAKAQAAVRRMAEDNIRKRMKRRREEEFLLLM